MDRHLTQIPHGVKIRTELDGILIELPEDSPSRPVPSILLNLLTPGSPLLLPLTFTTAFAGTLLPIFLAWGLAEGAALLGFSRSIMLYVMMILLFVGVPVGMGIGLRLPQRLYRRLSRPRPGRRITLRLGLHDITLPHSGHSRTILLSDVLFIEPGPPPKLVLTGAERLEFGGSLPRATQQWLIKLLESARRRRGTDRGESEIPTDLRTLQQQTDIA